MGTKLFPSLKTMSRFTYTRPWMPPRLS